MLNPMQPGSRHLFQSDSLTQVLKRAAIFGEKRHDVLVGNIANIDTPTYKTRDLDTEGFQHALEAAVQARRTPSPAIDYSTHPYLNDSISRPDLDNPILATPRNITFQDGNNRSIEQEMAALSKNIMRQSFLIQVMSAQFAQLESVISERL